MVVRAQGMDQSAWVRATQRSRRDALLLGLSGLGTALAACAPAGGEQGPAVGNGLASQRNAVMEAWVHADTRSDWQKLTVQDYNAEKGSGITVNWTKLGSTAEVADKVVVTTAAGSGFPDMVDVEISQMGKLLKTPTPPLVAFNDYLKGKENDFFKPSFVDPWSLNGKYYGLGNELNVCLMAYRHDVFDRVGVKAPLRTWEEAVEAGKRLAAVAEFGLFFLRTGTGTFTLFNIPGGGGYLDKGTKLILNHPANVKALQYMVDLVHRHKVATIDPGAAALNDALNSGKIAGELGPTWRISGAIRTNAKDTDGRWMVQHLPQWDNKGTKLTTTQGGTGMTVLKESKFKDIAVDYLIWEHSTKAVLRDFELRQVWPTYKKVYDDPRLTEPVPWFNNQRVGQFLKEGAEVMLPFFQGVWWPEVSSGAGKHITAALRNEMPVAQALDQAQNDARAAIEAAGGRVDSNGVIQS